MRSGAGQMIAKQAQFFHELDHDVTVVVETMSRHNAGRFPGIRVQRSPGLSRLLMSRERRDRQYSAQVTDARNTQAGLLIDHGPSFADADISYVHNFLAPEFAQRMEEYLPEHGKLPHLREAGREQQIVVANSEMVKRGVLEKTGLPERSVIVNYPGYDSSRFNLNTRNEYRGQTRRELGIDSERLLVGLITSGNFEKRGLARFLDCIGELQRVNPAIIALVVGGRRWPRQLKAHSCVRGGTVIFCKSTPAPERYFAALDVLLHPARYEEFGIVILEAMAMGVPVITCSAVGASELLRTVSDQLIVPAGADSVASYSQRVAGVFELNDSELTKLGTELSEEASLHTFEAHNEKMRKWIDR